MAGATASVMRRDATIFSISEISCNLLLIFWFLTQHLICGTAIVMGVCELATIYWTGNRTASESSLGHVEDFYQLVQALPYDKLITFGAWTFTTLVLGTTSMLIAHVISTRHSEWAEHEAHPTITRHRAISLMLEAHITTLASGIAVCLWSTFPYAMYRGVPVASIIGFVAMSVMFIKAIRRSVSEPIPGIAIRKPIPTATRDVIYAAIILIALGLYHAPQFGYEIKISFFRPSVLNMIFQWYSVMISMPAFIHMLLTDTANVLKAVGLSCGAIVSSEDADINAVLMEAGAVATDAEKSTTETLLDEKVPLLEEELDEKIEEQPLIDLTKDS